MSIGLGSGKTNICGTSTIDEWKPILVLPNLDIRGAIECDYAAIVSPIDHRVERIRHAHPEFTDFLGKFSTQFKEQCWPSIFILRADAPETCHTAEAVTAFRDILSLSVIPLARAKRLIYDRGNPVTYSSAFQFYPWMLDKNYDDLIMSNPASLSTHLLNEFNGQTFPEQSRVTLFERDIDTPLAKCLLERWVERFVNGSAEWSDRALFRSLSMANEAAKMPAFVAPTFYDVGRTLALWISAFEILAHPGPGGKSDFCKVSEILDKVDWHDQKLITKAHSVTHKRETSPNVLAVWIYKKIYDLRNDYLHGNDVDASSLIIKDKKAVIDFAACLYRLALTGFLDLKISKPYPEHVDTASAAQFVSSLCEFNKPQTSLERAILTAI